MDISLHSLALSCELWPLKNHSKIKIISCRAFRSSMRSEPNYYEVQSLDSENVGAGEIKKAYRSMALQYYPDVCPPSRKEESARIFVEVQKAYQTVSDPIARRRYDCESGIVDLGGRNQKGQGRLGFSKSVLEEQLCELRRSDERMERKKNVST